MIRTTSIVLIVFVSLASVSLCKAPAIQESKCYKGIDEITKMYFFNKESQFLTKDSEEFQAVLNKALDLGTDCTGIGSTNKALGLILKKHFRDRNGEVQDPQKVKTEKSQKYAGKSKREIVQARIKSKQNKAAVRTKAAIGNPKKFAAEDDHKTELEFSVFIRAMKVEGETLRKDLKGPEKDHVLESMLNRMEILWDRCNVKGKNQERAERKKQ